MVKQYMRYLGGSKDQAAWRGHDDPRILNKGWVYAVRDIQVKDWYTTVILDSYPHMHFNSVCFSTPSACPVCCGFTDCEGGHD